MISKTLVKLIDEAIVPALILAGAKVLGVLFVNSLFNLNWSISSWQIIYSSRDDFIMANSYSSLIMYSVIVAGLIYVIIKAFYFHDSHVSPKVSAFLHLHRKDFIIQTTLGIYSKAIIWLSYTWLTTVILAIQFVFGLVFPWVLYLCAFVSIVATLLLLIDIEREFYIESSSNQEGIRLINISDLARILKS